MTAPDLSVCVVNYNASRYLGGMLESVLNDTFVIDGRPGTLEVVLIDNASREEDHRELERLGSHPAVTLLRNSENVGYALANNQGFTVSRGRWHMVLNPDARLIKGCIQALIDTLVARPNAGLVGPLATMDDDGFVLMPPNELPDPYNESLSALAKAYPGLARFNMRRRTRYAWRYWIATEPLRMPMLSGACFLGAREVIQQYGLFDPGYPLYYEDTDLFRRYHVAEKELWHAPAARIVHLFQRSAMTRMKASMYRNEIGARRYFQTHFGEAGLKAYRTTKHRYETMGRGHEEPMETIALDPTQTAPVFPMPEVEGAYLEISGNPQFTLAVGLFPDQPGPYTLPASFWEPLGPNKYWARTVDPQTFETLTAWLITKI